MSRQESLVSEQPASPHAQGDDRIRERSLRPSRLGDFLGQEELKQNLSILVRAARKRGEALEHLLFYGPPGLGKTTLAFLLAHEVEGEMISTSGPALERPSELVGLLTSLKPRGILFVDEIHRIPRAVEEYLYSAMEDFRLDILLDRGPAARSVQLHLPPFTLIGATTRMGLLTAPLRGRFGFVAHLDFYPVDDLCRLVRRSAAILDTAVNEEGEMEIARRSRGTPRVANRLLRRVRDYADVHDLPEITAEVADTALALLKIDQHGLHDMDRRLLETIAQKFEGGPVGLGTLAAVLGEEEDTVEDLLEPYLIQQGLIQRTRRGREATPHAYEVLGLEPRRTQKRLL